MKHIVIFCDKTIIEKHDKNGQTDSILKTKLEKAEHEQIRKTIASNETEKKTFCINVSSRNTTTTLNTNPNLLKATNIIDKNENLNKTTSAEILRANI